MDDAATVQPVLRVRFYRTPAGREPVREWLRARSRDDRRAFAKTSSRTSRRELEVARHRLAAAWTKEIE